MAAKVGHTAALDEDARVLQFNKAFLHQTKSQLAMSEQRRHTLRRSVNAQKHLVPSAARETRHWEGKGMSNPARTQQLLAINGDVIKRMEERIARFTSPHK